MEEHLIKLLLENYKEKGVDLYAVLQDPLFTSLPLEKKIALLKQHAGEIAAGTSKVSTPDDRKAVIKDILLSTLGGGFLGASSAIGALKYFNDGSTLGGKVPWGSIAAGAALGGAAFSYGTYRKAQGLVADRKEIAEKLETVAEKQDTPSALAVLIARNRQVNPVGGLHASSAADSAVTSALGPLPMKLLKETVPSVLALRSMHINQNSPINPEYTKDQVEAAYQAAKDHANPMPKI